MASIHYKDADSVETYPFDWSTELEQFGSPTDAISSVTYTVPGGITKDAESFAGNETYVTLSGGTAGQLYRLLVEITTVNGRTYQGTVLVRVIDYAIGSPQPETSALVVEDGTPLTNSNTYLSVDDADRYHALRANSAWLTAALETKEAALVKAAFFLVAKYRMRWKGIRVDRDQALDWPRAGVITEDFFNPQTDPRPALFPNLAFEVPENEIPQEVKDAQCEIALRIVSGTDVLPDVTSGGDIRMLQAGPVRVEYFGAGGGSEPTAEFPFVDSLVRPYLRRGRSVVRG